MIPPRSRTEGVVDVPSELGRVALLSDVHGNMVALNAVLQEVEATGVDAICQLGDLVWGPRPREVIERLAQVTIPVHHVRGNAERVVREYARGLYEPDTPRFAFVADALGQDGLDTISAFAPSLRIHVTGIGALRLCHGSPRSDVELMTPGRDPLVVLEAARGLHDEFGFAHGHTHIQYRREVSGLRVIAPGSVGEPYAVQTAGARWALVGADVPGEVDLRTTELDLADVEESARDVGYPGLERYIAGLRTPPTLAYLEADAALRGFAD